MRPEALLAAVGLVVFIATVGVALLIPGFVAEPESDEPPARLDVAETTLETGTITGETVTFDVTAFVTNRGGPAENVSVVVRAIDDSGVVADAASVDRSTLDGGGEHELSASVTVPREGSYEIRTILYVDGERVDVASASVGGVEALTPPYAESNVEFHRFSQSQQPAVEYAISSVEDGDATLEVTSYLMNGGDESESDLRIAVTARHAAANVVADRAETTVGSIEAGRTETVETSVTVPNESNYYLDVTLWRDDVVLESTRTAANLNPQRTVDVEERTEPVAFEAGEFETDGTGSARPEPDEASDAESQPGFGASVALVALLLGAVAARRWSR